MMAKATSRAARGRWLRVPRLALHAGVRARDVLADAAAHRRHAVAFARDWYGTVLPGGWTLDQFRAALGHDLTLPSIPNSLKYAALATVVDLVLGVAIAYVVVRTKLAGRQILDAMAMLPLAVPGPGARVRLHLAMTQDGQDVRLPESRRRSAAPAGHRLQPCAGCPTSCAAPPPASSKPASPSRRPRKISAARRCARLRKITLPLIAANLIAGGLLAFSFAMLEVCDSLILAQKQQDYPDHQGDLRTLPAPRRRPLHRHRARRLGDGVPRRHDPRRQPGARQKAGRDLPGVVSAVRTLDSGKIRAK